jgi:hypothetical protein
MSTADPSNEPIARDFLTYEHIGVILAAVGEEDAATFADWDGLLHDLQSAYYKLRVWRNIERSPTDMQLEKDAEEMAAAAKKLFRLLKRHLSEGSKPHHLLRSLEIEADALLWSSQPFSGFDGKLYIEEFCQDLSVFEEIAEKVQRKAAKDELRWLPSRKRSGSAMPSANAELIARALPAMFEHYFGQKFSIRRRRDDTLHGPSLRFVQAVLAVMDVKDADGKDFSPAAIRQTYKRYRLRGDKVPQKS